METQPRRGTRRGASLLGIAMTALAVGAAIPVPTAGLALVWGPAEAAKPILVPAAGWLSGSTGSFEHWPAPASLALVSAVNGLLYALVALAVAAVARSVRRGDRPPG